MSITIDNDLPTTRRKTASPAAQGSDSKSIAEQRAVFSIDIRRTALQLAAIAALIATVGTIADYIIYQVAETPETTLARVMRRFDLGHEPSLPAFFSAVLILTNGLLLMLIGALETRKGSAYKMHWFSLGAIITLLAIDEAIMFHEMINGLIHLFVIPSGFLLLPWVIAGFAFSLAVFVAYFSFLRHLPRKTALLFVASGAIFVGGAVGMETIAAGVIDKHGLDSIQHIFVQTIEESMEMAGMVLFFFTLLDYISQGHRRLDFYLK